MQAAKYYPKFVVVTNSLPQKKQICYSDNLCDTCITHGYAGKLIAEVSMKKLLWGMAIGAIAGAVAYKKMQDDKIPERVIDAAKEKMSD